MACSQKESFNFTCFRTKQCFPILNNILYEIRNISYQLCNKKTSREAGSNGCLNVYKFGTINSQTYFPLFYQIGMCGRNCPSEKRNPRDKRSTCKDSFVGNNILIAMS